MALKLINTKCYSTLQLNWTQLLICRLVCRLDCGMLQLNRFARSYCTRAAPFAPCVNEKGERLLYPSHKLTSLSQRLVLTIGSGLMAFANPGRGDMVAVFGEATGYYALQHMTNQMAQDPTGRKILKEKPRIISSTVDMEKLRKLPDDTFGKSYVTFMDKYKLSPDGRAQVKYIDDTGLAYVMQRYREVHDLIHVVNGMGIGLLGEIAIKWFEAIQTGLPMCVLASVGPPITLSPELKKVFKYQLLPWIIPNAWNSKFYMNIYFEKHWEQPLDSFRQQFNLTPPPADTLQYTEPVHS